jgi:hypothetical protein
VAASLYAVWQEWSFLSPPRLVSLRYSCQRAALPESSHAPSIWVSAYRSVVQDQNTTSGRCGYSS